jgi:hypothetical protein
VSGICGWTSVVSHMLDDQPTNNIVVQQEGLHKGRRSLRRKPHCWSTETKSCWSMLEELRDGVHIISKRQHQCNFLATVKTKGKKLKELLRDLSEPRHLTIMDEHALNKQIPTM